MNFKYKVMHLCVPHDFLKSKSAQAPPVEARTVSCDRGFNHDIIVMKTLGNIGNCIGWHSIKLFNIGSYN